MAVRTVTVTLPEELYDLVERARAVDRRSHSEIIQEALRAHFGEAKFVPSVDERRLLVEALDEVARAPESVEEWADVRERLWAD